MSTVLVSPGSSRSESIALQTRKKRNIPNSQTFDLGEWDRRSAADIRKTYEGPGAAFGSGPSPLYNCHGLVFASRRTCILDPSLILKILEDDGFMEVGADSLLPGDVILYHANGEILHSGVVVKMTEFGPFVWSKWGKGHEVVHMYSQCPYKVDAVKYFRMVSHDKYD